MNGRRRFYDGAVALAGQEAILIVAHPGDGVGEPHPDHDQEDRDPQAEHVHDHAVAIVVLALLTLVFGKMVVGNVAVGRIVAPAPRWRAPRSKWDDAVVLLRRQDLI